ncbi:MAG: hypothetical protein QM658_02305 [Gordonia sp. (in: high G+C Gram-positive bacteria)]
MNQPTSGQDRRDGEESHPHELHGRHSAASVEPTTVVPLGPSGPENVVPQPDDAQNPAGAPQSDSAGTVVISTSSAEAARTEAARTEIVSAPPTGDGETRVVTLPPAGDGATQVVSVRPADEPRAEEHAPQPQFAEAQYGQASNPQAEYGQASNSQGRYVQAPNPRAQYGQTTIGQPQFAQAPNTPTSNPYASNPYAPNVYAPNAYAPNASAPFGQPPYVPNQQFPNQPPQQYPYSGGVPGAPVGVYPGARAQSPRDPNARSALSRGVIFGVVVIVGYFVTSLIVSIIGDHLPYDNERVWAMYSLCWILPYFVVAVMTVAAADTKVRSRLGASIAALLAVIVYGLWRAYDAWRYVGHHHIEHFTLYRVVVYTLIGLNVALLMAAWFLGRRRSLIVLVLAPVAGVVAGLAVWGTDELIGSDFLDGAGDLVRDLVWTTIDTATMAVIAVLFAWLAVLLDNALTPARPAASSTR